MKNFFLASRRFKRDDAWLFFIQPSINLIAVAILSTDIKLLKQPTNNLLHPFLLQ